MKLTRRLVLSSIAGFAAAPAFAQFTGPSVTGTPSSVAQVQDARPGTYVTMEGNIVAHLRDEYFQFSDGTGQIRVEIPDATFGGRQVDAQTRVRITGEVDRGRLGRYVWAKTLQIL